MDSKMKNKILVIDDQEIIHNDFKKILGEKRVNEAQNMINTGWIALYKARRGLNG